MPKTGTTTPARRIHAAIAAAMADPAVLARWSSDPGALKAEGLDDLTLDLAKMRHFAGLTVKVRHNDLRLDMPLSFALLDRLKLSIPLFADYALAAAELRAAGKTGRADKMHALYRFLGDWIDPDDPAHRIAWDLFRHEYILQTLRKATFARGADPVPGRPRPIGKIVKDAFTTDPLTLERRVAAGDTPKAAPTDRRVICVYHRRDAGAGIRVLEIDSLGGVMLDLADGDRNAEDIAAILAGAGLALAPARVAEALGALADMDLLTR